METKAVRIFYRKSDNQIVWTHTVVDFMGRTPAFFPTTIEEDLAKIPDKPKLNSDGSIIEGTRLGGVVEEYDYVQEDDSQRAQDALDSDENRIVNKRLIVGRKRSAGAR